jgi:hypothetical protein
LLTALYLHLGPFSRHVIRQIEQQLDRPQDISPLANAFCRYLEMAVKI